MVDESATAPQEQSLFVKDRVAARKVGASSLETAARGGGGQGWGQGIAGQQAAAPRSI